MINKNKKQEEDVTLSSEEKDSIFELIKEVS